MPLPTREEHLRECKVCRNVRCCDVMEAIKKQETPLVGTPEPEPLRGPVITGTVKDELREINPPDVFGEPIPTPTPETRPVLTNTLPIDNVLKSTSDGKNITVVVNEGGSIKENL